MHVDRVAGGAGDRADEEAVFVEKGIDEGGFTGIGFSDDGDFYFVVLFLLLGGLFREAFDGFVEQVVDPDPVEGGYGE